MVAVLDLIIFSHKTTAWTKVVFFLCSYCVCPSTQICRSHSLLFVPTTDYLLVFPTRSLPGIYDVVSLDRSNLALTTCCWSGAVDRPACPAIALWLCPVKIRISGFDPPVRSAHLCKCIDLIPHLLPPPPFWTSTLGTCCVDSFRNLPGCLTQHIVGLSTVICYTFSWIPYSRSIFSCFQRVTTDCKQWDLST